MSNWEYLPIEKNATVINGYSFKSGDFSSLNEVQSIKITNVGVQEFFCETDSLLPSIYIDSYSNYIISSGDIVIALTRTLISAGLKVAIVPPEFNGALLNQRVAAIKTNPAKLDKYFLYYYLCSQYAYDYVKSSVNELMQPNLSIKDLKGFSIPTPPLEEQKLIVAILDQAFADIEQARAKTEQNLLNARELFESYLQQVFSQRREGWVEEPMNKLFKIKHGYAFKSQDFRTEYTGDNPIVLTPGNYSVYGDLYFTKKNTKRCISEYSRDFLFKEGDLTIVMTDLSSQMKILGKPALIGAGNILHNQRIGKFEFLTEQIDREYLYYFLLSGLSLNNIRSSATGATVRHTAPSRILNNKIPFPVSLDEQSKLTHALREVNRETKLLEINCKEKLSKLDELKKSILQKAFSGQLTQTVEPADGKGAAA